MGAARKTAVSIHDYLTTGVWYPGQLLAISY